MPMRRLALFCLLLVGTLLLAVPIFAQTTITAQPIAYGDTVEGQLTTDALLQRFVFTAREGDIVTIRLDSVNNDFDAVLRLLNADGQQVAFNDDRRASRNSEIAAYMIGRAGEYTIVASSLNGRQTGAFVLSLETGVPLQLMLTPTPFVSLPTPTPTAVPAQISDGDIIAYGQTVTGELTQAAPSRSYTFSGSAGDAVLMTLDAVNDGFDTTLTLNDSFGTQLAYNDDSRGTLNSQIGPFVLPANGQYTLLVNSFSGSAIGAFTLTLSVVSSQPIAFGEPVTVSFGEAGREFFLTFTASTGDLIDILVDSTRINQIDTAFNLLDPSGYTVITDEDSGSGPNPEINGYLISSSGTFTIQLFLQETMGDATGDVTVTLMRHVPPSLDEGAQTLRFSSSAQQHSLGFSGVSGERVRLVLTQEGGRQSSSLSVDVFQGESIARLSTFNGMSASVEFIVPADGDLSVMVSEYSYTDLVIIVTLERLGQ